MRFLVAVLLLISAAMGQNLPDNPKPRLNKVFWSAILTDFALSNLDASASCSNISHGLSGSYETNPIYGGRKPSCARFFVQMNVQTLGVSLLSAMFKRNKSLRKFWIAPSTVDGSLHFVGFVQTLKSAQSAKDFCKVYPTSPSCQ